MMALRVPIAPTRKGLRFRHTVTDPYDDQLRLPCCATRHDAVNNMAVRRDLNLTNYRVIAQARLLAEEYDL